MSVYKHYIQKHWKNWSNLLYTLFRLFYGLFVIISFVRCIYWSSQCLSLNILLTRTHLFLNNLGQYSKISRNERLLDIGEDTMKEQNSMPCALAWKMYVINHPLRNTKYKWRCWGGEEIDKIELSGGFWCGICPLSWT